MVDDQAILQCGIRTIEIEHKAIGQLIGKLDDSFIKACHLLLNCEGRIVVTGMGKSGHIAKKIAATLSSTGSPAIYVHPAEASHGDLGMIMGKDVVLALSNSGTTNEVTAILPLIKRKGIPLISMTGDKDSPIAQFAEINLDASFEEEACPLGLAPTTSTTIALALGDALAMALLEARGFTAEDFAFSHPGGNLGRKLLLKVKDIMHSGNAIPHVTADTLLSEGLLEVTKKTLGMTTVLDSENKLIGVFTDGDLRRCIDAGKNIHVTPMADVMSSHYKHIYSGALASEAARLMQDNEIYCLIVLDQTDNLEGIVTMHDLLQAGVV